VPGPHRGRPLLAYWLDLLFAAGLERVVVNTHHLPEQVLAFLSSSPHAGRVQAEYEPELVGTGGSILRHHASMGPGPFLVAHADNLSRFDVGVLTCTGHARPAVS
jgi:mannose-1-phosphate guanylyltransferase